MSAVETRPAPRIQSLTDLDDINAGQLMELYRHGRRPASVHEIDGDPAGFAVGLHHLAGGRLERWLRGLARADRFIWHGKSFRSFSDEDGWGFNRVRKGPFLNALPFR